MASISKTAKGYRVFLEVKGVRKTKTFPTSREAKEWAAAEEVNMRNFSALPLGSKHTLAQAIERYRDEITIRNRGAAKEKIRCNYFLKHPELLPLDRAINAVTTEDITSYITKRLATVKPNSTEKIKPGSVRRDLVILSGLMEACRKEWKWILINPVQDANKPKRPKHRKRLITRAEIKSMLRGLKYSPQAKKVSTKMQAVAVCFLMSLRTGMRSGDMTNLEWRSVHPRYLDIVADKNNADEGRDVPLSLKAVRLLKKMRGFHPTSVFNLSLDSRASLFKKIQNRQKLSGFTFHDARHTAATWMAKSFKSDPSVTPQQAIFDFCKIFGWTDADRALEYFNPNPEDLASRLD